MSPVEVRINDRLVGTSGSGYSSMRDVETGIQVFYTGDNLGIVSFYREGVSLGVLEDLLMLGDEKSLRTNIVQKRVEAVEKGREPTPVYYTATVKRV